MVVAVHDLLGALANVGITIEAHGNSLRYRPASAMTPSLLATVKSCESELLELLAEPADVAPTLGAALFSRGPGAGPSVATLTPARTAPVAPEYSTTQAPSKADIEWDRFLACAISTPNGLGLYDPSESPDLPTGVPGAAWDAFVRDCGNVGRGSRALSLDGDQVRQAIVGDHGSAARFAERFLF